MTAQQSAVIMYPEIGVAISGCIFAREQVVSLKRREFMVANSVFLKSSRTKQEVLWAVLFFTIPITVFLRIIPRVSKLWHACSKIMSRLRIGK